MGKRTYYSREPMSLAYFDTEGKSRTADFGSKGEHEADERDGHLITLLDEKVEAGTLSRTKPKSKEE